MGWAIAGLGRLSLEELLPAFGESQKGRLVALVSGDAAKNMYTEPEWRGRGLARALFTELTRFARELGVGRLLLHAMPDGRPLFESVGVRPNPTSMEWTPGGE